MSQNIFSHVSLWFAIHFLLTASTIWTPQVQAQSFESFSSWSKSLVASPLRQKMQPVPSAQKQILQWQGVIQGHKQIVSVYPEDNLWHFQRLSYASDGWPEIKEHSSYSRFEQAQARFIQITNNQRGQLQSFLGETIASVELMGDRSLKLWEADKDWNWEWEKRFGEWIQSEIDIQFFRNHNLATDCADVAYSLRWIFARNHGLRMANRLADGRSILSHNSVRQAWSRLPTAKNWYEDQRFMAALNYLLDYSFTHSLQRDSYPIAISTESVFAGAYHLSLFGSTGHTYFVHRGESKSALLPLMVMYSTVPRSTRSLWESGFWVDQQPELNEGGFLRMRWPEFSGDRVSFKNPAQMPYYSEEQYDPNFIQKNRSFAQEVLLRLRPNIDFGVVIRQIYATIREQLNNRLSVVEQGYAICSRNPCRQGSSDWEDWSTPSRDGRLLSQFQLVREIIGNAGGNELTRLEEISELELRTPSLQFNGETYSLQAVRVTWAKKFFSSDPNDPPSVRWGLEAHPVGLKMIETLKTNFTKRDESIRNQGGRCQTPTCQIDSEYFQRYQTFTIDNELKSLAEFKASYCKATTPNQCEIFKAKTLSQPLNLRGMNQSLDAWINDVSWLNSDPRLSSQKRWVSYKDELNWIKLDDSLTEFIVDPNEWAFVKDNSGANFGKLRPGYLEEIPAPSNASWLAMNSESKWVLAQNEKLLFAFEKGKTKFSFEARLPFSAVDEVLWASGTHGFLRSGENVAPFRITEKSIQIAAVFSGQVTILNHRLSSIQNHEGHFELLDLKNNSIPSPVGFVRWLGSQGSLHLLQANQEGLNAAYIYDENANAGSQIRPWGSPLQILAVSTDGQAGIGLHTQENTVYTFSVDKKFSLLKQSARGPLAWARDKVVFYIEDDSLKPLIAGQSSIKEVPLLENEEGVWSVVGDLVIVGVGDASAVRRINERNYILKGGWIADILTDGLRHWAVQMIGGENYFEQLLVSLDRPEKHTLLSGRFNNFVIMEGEAPLPQNNIHRVIRSGVFIYDKTTTLWVGAFR